MGTDWHRFRQLSHIILMRRIAVGEPKARLQEKQKGQCQLDIGLLRCHPLRKFTSAFGENFSETAWVRRMA